MKNRRITDISASAFASQRKDFYEKAVSCMNAIEVLAYLAIVTLLILLVEHIVGWL